MDKQSEKDLREKRKVCVITTVHDTFDPRIFDKECKSLGKYYQVILLAPSGRDEFIENITVKRIKKPQNRILRFLLNLSVMFLALKEKADIYHFHDPEFQPAGIFLKIISGKPVIYDIHEDYPSFIYQKDYIPSFCKPLLSAMVKSLEKFTGSILDAIITADDGVASNFREFNKKIVLFNFPRKSFKNNTIVIPFKNRKYDFIYHGSAPKYHLKLLFDVSAILKQRAIETNACLICKDSSDNYKTWIRTELDSRQLNNNYEFFFGLHYTQIPDFLANSRIGIIPLPPFKKFMKNIPTKLFEFMLMEMPVVVSDLPPCRQFIANEECGYLVTPNDPQFYADAILNILDNPQKAIEMGKRGRALVEKRYNWENEEPKLLSLYQEILSPK